MALIYVLLTVFLLIAIAEQIYFYRKISGAVRYFGSNLSKGKRILLTVALFLLTFVPIPFAFVEWFILEMHIAVFLLLALFCFSQGFNGSIHYLRRIHY